MIQHFAEHPERPFTQVVFCQAKALAMLHSSSGRVHFPVNTGRADRRTIQRGRLQVSAAIKKGKEKNVVCTKTIVAKQETVRPMRPWHLHTCQPSLITLTTCRRKVMQTPRVLHQP